MSSLVACCCLRCTPCRSKDVSIGDKQAERTAVSEALHHEWGLIEGLLNSDTSQIDVEKLKNLAVLFHEVTKETFEKKQSIEGTSKWTSLLAGIAKGGRWGTLYLTGTLLLFTTITCSSEDPVLRYLCLAAAGLTYVTPVFTESFSKWDDNIAGERAKAEDVVERMVSEAKMLRQITRVLKDYQTVYLSPQENMEGVVPRLSKKGQALLAENNDREALLQSLKQEYRDLLTTPRNLDLLPVAFRKMGNWDRALAAIEAVRIIVQQPVDEAQPRNSLDESESAAVPLEDLRHQLLVPADEVPEDNVAVVVTENEVSSDEEVGYEMDDDVSTWLQGNGEKRDLDDELVDVV